MNADAEPGTPLPWNVNAGDEIKIMAIHLQVALAQCGGVSGIRLQEASANAAYIVTACNAYPQHIALIGELVEALGRVTGWQSSAEYHEFARATLAKAKAVLP